MRMYSESLLSLVQFSSLRQEIVDFLHSQKNEMAAKIRRHGSYKQEMKDLQKEASMPEILYN